MVRDHVVVEDLPELVVADAGEGAVVRIRRGIADDDVDAAEGFARAGDEVREIVLRRDARRNGDRAARTTCGVDAGGHFVARTGLPRRDHDLRAVLGEPLGDGAADAAGRSGDDGNLAGQVEQRRHGGSPPLLFFDVVRTRRAASAAHRVRRQNSPAVTHSATIAGFAPPSISTVTSHVACQRPGGASSAFRTKRPRTREPDGTGATKRRRLNP